MPCYLDNQLLSCNHANHACYYHAIFSNPPIQKLKPIKDICTELNLTQIIDKPTRVTAETESLIDIIMDSSPDLIKESDEWDICISDTV